MLQHILLWNYKDHTPSEERERLERELEELPSHVPSLQRVEWGPVVGGCNQNFTHCFVMHFTGLEGLNEYATHPPHLHFALPFKEACASQVVVDFETAATNEVTDD